MTGDLIQVVESATPYLTAAVSAYGGAVLAQVEDNAAEATVGVGRRILQRVFGARRDGEELPEELADVIAQPDDPDNVAALRKALRKAMEGDRELESEVRQLVAEAPSASGLRMTAMGERSVAVQANLGVIATGDGGSFTVKRDT
ncbi:hypothetical protein HUT06_01470 [Actinomadura sp. NAK00032]|uniref:hypothetical protein n=1 Tax=Actinomadura sp. NAK00032 TaxID=2742128 RepID=UPI001591F83F|nr:hypothetical protein [Actinomadura sp. NAK00032]QKW32869.1 hypothetical protein HUT06_01470 [Actinomadura sp. NAK00032]